MTRLWWCSALLAAVTIYIAHADSLPRNVNALDDNLGCGSLSKDLLRLRREKRILEKMNSELSQQLTKLTTNRAVDPDLKKCRAELSVAGSTCRTKLEDLARRISELGVKVCDEERACKSKDVALKSCRAQLSSCEERMLQKDEPETMQQTTPVPLPPSSVQTPSDTKLSCRALAKTLQMVNLGGHFYYFSSFKLPWYQARNYCEKQGHQMSLASVDSATENTYIVNYIALFLGRESVWLGGSDEDREGHWTWVSTGKPLQFSYWLQGQPEAHLGANQNCLATRGDAESRWDDQPCMRALHFVCEMNYNCV